MTQRELFEWRAWYAIEPRGEERADWQAGWIALWQVIVASGKKSRSKLKWPDFVPFRRAQTPEDKAKAVSKKLKAALERIGKRQN